MTRRLLLFVFALNLAAAPTASWAQQTNKIPVVGVLFSMTGPDVPLFEALQQGLRDSGFVEGRNIKIEFRTAQGHLERLPGLAEELVRLNVDVIFAPNPVAARALRNATSTIPIVVALFDPTASGLVTNLARPGGNITGLSSMTIDLLAKRLQLLKETIPRLARVAVLWNPSTPPTPIQAKFVEDLETAARSLSIELRFVIAQSSEEFDSAFAAISRARAQALYLSETPLHFVHGKTLAKLALNAGLPTIYGERTFVDGGGLMSYGASYVDQMRQAAGYIGRILKGAKPGDLPIEQPTKFELVVNLKTARALGITIPQSILLRADEVIR